MRFPSKQKYLKQQKGKKFNKISKVLYLTTTKFGLLRLKAIESGRITAKQLDAFFMCLNKFIKKTGYTWMHVFPQTPITKKPIEVRMGKGKGNVEYWICKIKAGSIICEVTSNLQSIAFKGLLTAKQKLPLRTKIY